MVRVVGKEGALGAGVGGNYIYALFLIFLSPGVYMPFF